MKKIPLTQGKVAIVDDEDYDYLMRWKWCASKTRKGYWYAERRAPHPTNGWKTPIKIKMHRFIMGAAEGLCVDHINHNTLDNRKCKMRICSYADNSRNKRASKKKCRSNYKGVYPNSVNWKAQIGFNYENIYLGTYTSESMAAKVYDKKAKELFGEFALLNFPEGQL